MDEEEAEIERNISDSKERVDDISNSKEGVDGISNSEDGVDAESEEKAYREYIFRNDFETMNVFEQDNNSGSRINQES